jgi:hypothetical protein
MQFLNTDYAWEKREGPSVEDGQYALLGESEDCNDNSLTNKRAIAFIVPLPFPGLARNSESKNLEWSS